MMPRFRTALAGVLVAGLAVPAVAPAMLDNVPSVETPDATPSCPTKPCYAVGRTTGYQAKVGENRGLYTVQHDGRIVSWSITLSKPNRKQIKFFDKSLGGESQAQISVLRMGHKLHARLVAQGEPQKLEPYFGQTVEFPLEQSIPVKKGYVIALTVPTWAPALAAGLPGDTSWRASRGKGTCDDSQTQTAQSVNQLAQYYCLYRTARLMYSARVITDPQPTEQPKRKKSKKKG
ncbi:MAG TPA: hypothetical protein VFT50_07505 [Baekduia sp.]|nr:hypothetical protein [Baekduia sp.]